jgi:phage terminase small subunit
VQGHRLLTRPNVQAFLSERLAAQWKRLEMSVDEATALVAQNARPDIRLLFDERGELRPPLEWPDGIARSVRSYAVGRHGPKVQLNDSLAARRLVLEFTGKLKARAVDGGDSLTTLLSEAFQHGRHDGTG